MICVLDANAAIEVILDRPKIKLIEPFIRDSEWVLSPEIFLAEVTNVFWKYNKLGILKRDFCEEGIEKTIQLVDHLESGTALYREAFDLSCKINLPVYDAFYLVLARRNSATLLSLDEKLNSAANLLDIRIL